MQQISSTGNASQTDPYGFGAQWGYFTDYTTGVTLAGHRYYDPAAGRWLNRDPIGYSGGLNLYGYVGDDPENISDPSGHFFWLVVGLAAYLWLESESPAGDVPPGYQHTTPADDINSELQRDAWSVYLGNDDSAIANPPTVPPAVIVKSNGVTIRHNYGGGQGLRGVPTEHGPAHAHVSGGGPETRIGPKGYPLKGDACPTAAQRAVIDANQTAIRRALNKIGRYLSGLQGSGEAGGIE